MFLQWIRTLLIWILAGALAGVAVYLAELFLPGPKSVWIIAGAIGFVVFPVFKLTMTVEDMAKRVGRIAQQVDDIEEYVAELYDVAGSHRDDAK